MYDSRPYDNAVEKATCNDVTYMLNQLKGNLFQIHTDDLRYKKLQDKSLKKCQLAERFEQLVKWSDPNVIIGFDETHQPDKATYIRYMSTLNPSDPMFTDVKKKVEVKYVDYLTEEYNIIIFGIKK